MQVQPLGWEDLLGEGMATTVVFLPGELHGQGSLAGCGPWGHTESDTTEVTKHTHAPTAGFLPGESHGQGSLAGYSPRGHRVGHA